MEVSLISIKVYSARSELRESATMVALFFRIKAVVLYVTTVRSLFKNK
jgi:hypothetical protein